MMALCNGGAGVEINGEGHNHTVVLIVKTGCYGPL